MKQTKQRYYLPFLSKPISKGGLKIPILTLALSVLAYIIANMSQVTPLVIIVILSLILSLVSLVLVVMNKRTNKFQVATLISIAIDLFLILVFFISLGLLMFSSSLSPENASINLLTWYSILYVVVMVLLSLAFILYYNHCYKIEKEKVLGMSGQKESDSNSKTMNYAIIFIAVILAPSFLTGYVMTGFAILFGLLLSVVWTGTIMDAIYAAYDAHKHSEDREEK